MESETNDYFPVPFSVDELPESLQSVVRPGIRDAIAREEAYRSIEEYWEDGGDRGAHLLLAYAFMRFTEACEIMVDRQREEAERALELCREARQTGEIDDRDELRTLAEFAEVCRDVRREEKQREDQLVALSHLPPSQLDPREAGSVAHELTQRGEDERAIPFFQRSLERDDIRVAQQAHTWVRIASCHREVGNRERAEEMFREIISKRGEIPDEKVGMAYNGWVRMASDDRLRERFDEAREWADQAGKEWPRSHPFQEELLERGLALDDTTIVTHAIDCIDGRDRPIPRELREKVDRARETYCGY